MLMKQITDSIIEDPESVKLADHTMIDWLKLLTSQHALFFAEFYESWEDVDRYDWMVIIDENIHMVEHVHKSKLSIKDMAILKDCYWDPDIIFKLEKQQILSLL